MESLSVRHYAQLLRYYRRLITWIVGGITLGTAALSVLLLLLLPNYTAASRAIMTPTEAEILFANDEAGGPRVVEGLAATHREYLMSRPVAEAVVDRLMETHEIDLDAASPGVLGALRSAIDGLRSFVGRTYRVLNSGTYVEKNARERAVEGLLNGTEVDSVEGSFILEIAVTLPFQDLVAPAANELAQVYVERVERDFEVASSSLAARYMEDVRAKESEIETLRDEERRSRRELGLQSSEEDRRSLSEAIETEREKYLDLEVEGRELEIEIASLRRAAETTTSTDFLNRVSESIAMSEARRDAVRSSLRLRRQTLQDLERQLDDVREQEAPLDDLLTKQRAAEEDLVELRDRLLQVELVNYGSSRIRIIEDARRPDYPSSPQVVIYTIAAFLASILIALFALVALDTGSETAKTESDLERLSRAPALGTLELGEARGFDAEAGWTADDLRERGVELRERLTVLTGAAPRRILLTGFVDRETLGATGSLLAVRLAASGDGTVSWGGGGRTTRFDIDTAGRVKAVEPDAVDAADAGLRIESLGPVRELTGGIDGDPATPVVCVVPAGKVEENELGVFLENASKAGRRVALLLVTG